MKLFLKLRLTPIYVPQSNKNMKRTIYKQCNTQRETIIGTETNCSECGTELIHIINESNNRNK